MYLEQNKKMIKSFILVYILGSILIGGIIQIVVLANNIHMNSLQFNHLGSCIIYFILGMIAIKLYGRMMYEEIKTEKQIIKFVTKVILFSCVFLVVNIFLGFISSHLFGITETDNEAMINSVTSMNMYLNIFCGVVTVLFGPIVEEIFFRFIIQNWLETKIKLMGGYFSVFIASVFFGFFHSGISIELLIYSLLGMILGTIYKKTNSITMVIMVHVINNFIVFVAL